MTCILVSSFLLQQLSLQHRNVDVRHNNNAPKELNDFIGGLLHLGLNVITFRTLLHLGPNVITFRTVITFRPSTGQGQFKITDYPSSPFKPLFLTF